ncbi:MAG: xanthine dehydrogenase family protein subunit M [Alphaproteobacteria bacterium]
MIPGSFDYHRPQSVADAVKLLADFGEEARVVAGGHSLIPMMKLRMAVPEHLVDLQDIADLRGIRVEGGTVTIGAMTTQAQVIASDALAAACPILRETALQIADPQIRNVGTIGGNVANGDPGNDMPALMLVLNATLVVQGAGGSREIAARAFYQGAFATALDEGEILTAIRFAAPPAGHGHAYEKQKRKVGDYATAAAGVILTVEGGRCTYAAIGLTNVADTPLYADAAVQALVGSDLGEAAVGAAAAAAEAIARPTADGRGPAEYRKKLTGVMVRRAVARARSLAGR